MDVNIQVFKFAPRHTLNLMQRIRAVGQVFGGRLAVRPGHKIISFCVFCVGIATGRFEIHLIFSALLKLCIRAKHFNLLCERNFAFEYVFGKIFGFHFVNGRSYFVRRNIVRMHR